MKFFFIIFANLVVLFVIIVVVLIIKRDMFRTNYVDYVSYISISLLSFQLIILYILKYSIFSFQTIFIILSYIFNFSFFWLISLGKADFIFFSTWIGTDMSEKCNSALFAIICIHAVFTGLVWKNSIVTENRKHYDDSKRVFTIGLVLMIVGIPFKLEYDYLNIINSIANGGYGGFAGTVGLVDDFQHFAIAGIICMIASGYKSRAFYLMLIITVFAYFFFVMTASGDRRYYVTAIIGIIMAYVGSRTIKQNKPGANRKRKGLLYVALFFGLIFLSNILNLIRNTRLHSLGSEIVSQTTFEQLFSLNGVWEAMGEFGVTINALLLAQQYVPDIIPYQYGLSYFYAILFILPIGSFLPIPNASIGRAITTTAGIPVGSSYVLDLYANFGYIAFIPAFIIGLIMSSIIGGTSNVSKKKLALTCSFSYILLNYVRASTIEIVRPVVYISISFVFFEWLIYKRIKKT